MPCSTGGEIQKIVPIKVLRGLSNTSVGGISSGALGAHSGCWGIPILQHTCRVTRITHHPGLRPAKPPGSVTAAWVYARATAVTQPACMWARPPCCPALGDNPSPDAVLPPDSHCYHPCLSPVPMAGSLPRLLAVPNMPSTSSAADFFCTIAMTLQVVGMC